MGTIAALNQMRDKMSVVCVIPLKKDSARLPNKNLELIGGTPIYEICLQKIRKLQQDKVLDRVYVDTDIKEVQEHVRQNYKSFEVIERVPRLTLGDIRANDLMLYHVIETNAQPEDIFCHAFITTPFSDIEKMKKCVEAVAAGASSAFIAERMQTHMFNKDGEPLFEGMPASQELDPLYKDTGAFFAVRVSEFMNQRSRYCKRCQIVECEGIEGVDINTRADLELAKAIGGLGKNASV